MEHGFYRNGRFTRIPSTLDECKTELAVKLLRIVSSHISTSKKAHRAAARLLRMKFGWAFVGAPFRPTTDELCDFYLLGKHITSAERLPHTKNHLPRLGKLIGPADGLGNIVFVEWIKCFMYHKALARTKDPKYLHLLIAVLYRPEKSKWQQLWERLHLFGHAPSDDARERYTDATLHARAEHIGKTWLAWQKNAVLLYYIGSVQQIAKTNAVFQNEDADPNSQFGWDDTLYELSELKHETPETVAFWRFDEVLFILNKALKRNASK